MLPKALTGAEYLPASARAELDFTAPVKPGSPVASARRVQEWVSLAGHGLDVDGDFGSATTKQVTAFQAASGLPATGVVDFDTWQKLVDPMVRALKPIAPAGQGLSALIGAYAAQHVAQHPLEAGGDNRGPWVRAYVGWDGKAARWCAGFASFMLRQAAHTLGGAPPIHGSESCITIGEQAHGVGKLKLAAHTSHSAGAIPVGSFFLVGTPGTYHHIGVVRHADLDTFDTWEGNTDHAGSDNGYEASQRTRSYGGKDFVVW